MKEHPILFSSPMIKAILEGKKTQTRRVMKLQPVMVLPPGSIPNESNLSELICPYGYRGDLLWVRETFTIETNFNLDPCEPPFKDGRPVKWTEDESFGRYWEQAHYRATDPSPDLVHEEDCRKCEDNGYCNSWKPSIHMPRWASRIKLVVTNVRVERVQGISKADCMAEGMAGLEDVHAGWHQSYAELWDSINAERGFGWVKNPWVWVIEFRRLI